MYIWYTNLDIRSQDGQVRTHTLILVSPIQFSDVIVYDPIGGDGDSGGIILGGYSPPASHSTLV